MTNIPPQPIMVLDLFPELQEALLDLLASLTDNEWALPTVCAGWSVKDLALHLLGDSIGWLSRRRDGHGQKSTFASWEELVQFVNDLNDQWVTTTRRMSARVVCDLLKFTGDQFTAYLQTLDPYALGAPVSWAGSDPAPIWLDIAREYTEYWMHQQHIRDAVGKAGMKERRFFAPVLDTFIRAMPHTYRGIEAAAHTRIKLAITGEAGGVWNLVRMENRWELYAESDLPVTCLVRMDAETAWRRFTKGISKDEARRSTSFEGDAAIGLPVLDMVSFIG